MSFQAITLLGEICTRQIENLPLEKATELGVSGTFCCLRQNPRGILSGTYWLFKTIERRQTEKRFISTARII